MSSRPETVPKDQDEQIVTDQEFIQRATGLFDEPLESIPQETVEKLERARKAAVAAAADGRKR